MAVVGIKGKKYGVGFEWDTDDNEERAKARTAQLRRKGYFADIVKVGKSHFQVYSCDKFDGAAKHTPLAVGYLHLAGGYYYMRLEDKVWVLIKAGDGTIAHEGLYESLEDFENKKYDFLSSVVDNPQEKREITIEEGKFKMKLGLFKNLDLKKSGKSSGSLSVPKRVLAFLFLAVLLLAGMFVYFTRSGEPELPKTKNQQKVNPSPSPQMVKVESQESQGVKVEEKVLLKVGKIDLSCYDQFYTKAFTENQGSCEWQLTPEIPIDSVKIPACKEALEGLTLLGTRIQWGQVEDYGEFLAYSFSISGQMYASDLKVMSGLYFSSLSLKLEGGISSVMTTISGVVICKRT